MTREVKHKKKNLFTFVLFLGRGRVCPGAYSGVSRRGCWLHYCKAPIKKKKYTLYIKREYYQEREAAKKILLLISGPLRGGGGKGPGH